MYIETLICEGKILIFLEKYVTWSWYW